jgi:hypothetical protein
VALQVSDGAILTFSYVPPSSSCRMVRLRSHTVSPVFVSVELVHPRA